MVEPVPAAVRHWIEDAEAAYGPSFEAWFPPAFDWRALCEDAPRFAEELGEAWKPETEPAAKARLEDLAAAAFRGGYVAAVALLAAYDASRDPDQALDRLTQPLSDEETEAFEAGVAEDLASAEELIAGETPAALPTNAARAAAEMLKPALPAIRDVLAGGLRSAARVLASLGAGGTPSARVLTGVVNVAVALAGLRYLAAAAADGAGGREPLRFDPAAMAAVLG